MDRVLYCKYDNERAPRFSLHTLLLEEEKSGQRYVCKVPDSQEAEPHVQRMVSCGEKLEAYYDPEQLRINRCVFANGKARMAYLAGETLEEKIDRTVAEEGPEAATALIRQFFARTQPGQGLQPFCETEEFRAVFGSHPELAGLPALPTADLDLLFSHVIVREDGWYLNEYEWTCFFPVPAEFLRYRAQNAFLAGGIGREWAEETGAEVWGIEPQRLPVWDAMEQAFQEYVCGDCIPLQKLYGQLSPGVVDLPALEALDRQIKMQQAQTAPQGSPAAESADQNSLLRRAYRKLRRTLH